MSPARVNTKVFAACLFVEVLCKSRYLCTTGPTYHVFVQNDNRSATPIAAGRACYVFRVTVTNLV